MAESLVRARVWGRVRVAVLLVIVVGVVAATAGAAWAWVEHEFRAPGPAAAATRIEVEPGTSVRTVLVRLESSGNLRHARAVEWYLRVHGFRPRMQSGAYELPAHSSPAQILALFEEGKVILEQVTVVEGATFADFLGALEEHPRIAHTLHGKSPAEIMAALGHPGLAPEGEFFPDTYRFAANTTDAAILTLGYESMQRALAAAWRSRSSGLPLETPYQALILASVIEKEAALESERPLIAGVFINRLRKGMRLQSDPTVVYGLGENYDGTIHTRDLLRDNPYNTYTREGLPPTPIALPGRESLQAAVQPAPTAALYFVATGLGDGAHHFSSSLQEHNAAVQTYLERLRASARAAATTKSSQSAPVASGSEGAHQP